MNTQTQLNASSSLEAWLSYLETLHPTAIDLGLTRLEVVAKQLDLPLSPTNRRFKVVLAAGTNGKGSSLAYLQNLGLAAGLKVATYTSPHFLRFTERLLINGQEVSPKALTLALHQVNLARLACQPEVSLTYFEFTTLACLLIIQQEAPDLALLEVGLGGRLDAVNLVSADLGIITSISYDHADFLGTDIEEIGKEKAGILRPAMPAILASQNLPLSVKQTAEQLDCPVFQLGQEIQLDNQQLSFSLADQQQTLNLDKLQLPIESAAAAVQAFALLYPQETSKLLAENNQLTATLETTQLVGRRQQLGAWLLDVAHNPAAAEYLATHLKAEDAPVKRVALVGMMADKDLAATLKPLLPLVDTWITTPLPLPRAASAEQLAETLANLGAKQVISTYCPHATEAVKLAQQQLELGFTQVLVMGSFFTLAEVLPQLSALSTAMSSTQGD